MWGEVFYNLSINKWDIKGGENGRKWIWEYLLMMRIILGGVHGHPFFLNFGAIIKL